MGSRGSGGRCANHYGCHYAEPHRYSRHVPQYRGKGGGDIDTGGGGGNYTPPVTYHWDGWVKYSYVSRTSTTVTIKCECHMSGNTSGSYTVHVGNSTKKTSGSPGSYPKTFNVTAKITPDTTSIKCYATPSKVSGGKKITFQKMPRYNVSYISKSAESGSVDAQVKYKGEDLTTRANKFKRTGYHADYWHGSHGDVKIQGKYTVDANETFSPLWLINTYTIQYLDGIHPGCDLRYVTGKTSFPNTKCTYGVEASLRNPNNYWILDGYDFVKWKHVNQDGTSRSFSATQKVINLTAKDKDIYSLTAQWTPKVFTNTFNINYKTEQIEPASFTNNLSTYTNNATFYANYYFPNSSIIKPRTRWRFIGWSTSNSAATPQYTPNYFVEHWNEITNKTYYAVWEDTYNPPKFIDHIRNNCFRCSPTGIENDNGTCLHINELNFTPANLGVSTTKYYTSTITISARLHGGLGATQLCSYTFNAATGVTTPKTATLSPKTITNYTFNTASEYDIICTISNPNISGLIGEYSRSEIAVIYTGIFPFEVGANEENIGIQTIATNARQGLTLAGSTSKARDLYLDIRDNYLEDQLFLDACSNINIANIPNQNSNERVALELRDDGNLASFGRTTPNLVTTQANNGQNKAYYGISLNYSDKSNSDIYYDFNNSTMDQSFVTNYNQWTNYQNLTLSNAQTRQIGEKGIEFSNDAALCSIGNNLDGSEVNPSHNIPEGYIELDYIGFTGLQALNLGFVPTTTSKIILDYECCDNNNNTGIIGVEASNEHMNIYFDNTGNICYSIGSTTGVSVGRQYNSNKTKLTIDLKSLQLISEKGLTYNIALANFTCSHNLSCYLGAIYSTNKIERYAKGLKVYSVQLFTNNVLTKHYIPVMRIADGKIGLYDIVTRSFVYNLANSQANCLAGPSIHKAGLLIQKGTINNTGIAECRDIYFIGQDLDERVSDMFGEEYVNNYGTVTISRLNNTVNEYSYLPSQTWEQWIGTGLNEDNIHIYNNRVYNSNNSGYLFELESGTPVMPFDMIYNIPYGWSNEKIKTFTINNVIYNGVTSLSWQIWFNSIFNTNSAFNMNNSYIYTATDSLSIIGGEDAASSLTTTYGYLSYNGTYVNIQELPVENRAYTLTNVTVAAGEPADGGEPGGTSQGGGSDAPPTSDDAED